MNSRQGLAPIGIIVVIVVALFAGGGYYASKKIAFEKYGFKDPHIPPYVDIIPEMDDWKTYPSTGSGQADMDISSWKTYRNEKYGFEIKYPNSWFIQYPEEGKFRLILQLATTPVEKNIIANADWLETALGALGSPPENAMWVSVERQPIPTTHQCDMEDGFKRVPAQGAPGFLRAKICYSNFNIFLYLYDTPQKEDQKKILEAIYRTFKTFPPQGPHSL